MQGRRQSLFRDGSEDAVFDPTRTYRYRLTRHTGAGIGTLLFVMLNPSTADEYRNDPTVRRCIAFARAWGFGRLCVGNIFAFRSTDPAAVDWFARRYAPEFFKSAEVGADHDWQPEPAPRDSICSHRDANGDICLLPESHHPDRVLSDPAVLERYQELASCFLRVLADWPGAKGGASA